MKIKKKELIIGIVAIVLIAAIGIAYGISKQGSTTDKPKKIEKISKKEDKKKVKTTGVKPGKAEDKKTDAKSDVRAEDDKKKESVDKAAKSENNSTKTSSNSKPSTHNASTPSHSISSDSGSAPAPKPKRWVVDKPAWDEEVRQPVYVNTWWCRLEDGTMLTFYSEQEAYNYYMNNFCSWGTGDRVPDPSGATEVVGYIHHDEVGHWE
jgi:hypothetical protein|uniref:Uncharacterized protein n=1 Tax=Siphoviridae sp. ctutT7 TaxID=2826506 RepID=A0A8S5MVC2_9CAUD|nr:MAG TPA: hypothetical protein [Siphoviridae sp. ctutT7]